jgi:hypothetical protein
MDKTKVAEAVASAITNPDPIVRIIVVDLDAAWPKYTLTDDDRQAWFDPALLSALPTGGVFAIAPDTLVKAPEQVRSHVRSMFTRIGLRAVRAGVYLVPASKAADAEAAVKAVESYVNDKESALQQEWAAEFPSWYAQAGTVAQTACRKKGFDQPRPYWVKANVYSIDVGGVDVQRMAADVAKAESERAHAELRAALQRWRKVVGSRGLTLGHVQSLSAMIAKVYPNSQCPCCAGKKTLPLAHEEAVKWADACRAVLQPDEWAEVEPVLGQYRAAQAVQAVQTPAPEPAPQSEPQPAPVPEPQPAPQPAQTPAEPMPEPVKVDNWDEFNALFS